MEELTKGTLSLMNSENPEIDFELKGVEVFALYSLGQMHGKVVQMQDDQFAEARIGLFTIDHINGNRDLDFSKIEDWRKVDLDSISYTLTIQDKWGQRSSTYESLAHIKSIGLLKQ